MDKPGYWKLFAGLAVDAIGMANYAYGEGLDLVWAPASAIALYLLYRDKNISAFGFGEEILPFTDFIPSATLAWLWLRRKTK